MIPQSPSAAFRIALLLGVAFLSPKLSAAPLTQWAIADGGNDHFYQVFSRENFIQWSDASAHAQSLGGYLATLTTALENDFVRALTQSENGWLEAWIGLTDEVDEGVFLWVTGETSAYTNWYPGEPNNDPDFNGEDYAIINPPVIPPDLIGGTWNDLPNNPARVKAWVVEWQERPLSSVPEPSTLWTLALALGLLTRFRPRS